MKTFSFGSLLLYGILLLTACSKSDKAGTKSTETLSAGKTEIKLSAAGGKETIQINASSSWELTGLPDWLQANPSKGNGNTTVELTIAPNMSGREQKATIVLKSGDLAPVSITIQLAAASLVITDFTAHAKGEDDLVINGAGFSDVPAENTVTVNGKPATVKLATGARLTVTVPLKAGSGKIEITTAGKTVTSTTDFIYEWVGVVSTVYTGNVLTFYPRDLIFNQAGTLYIADQHRVMKMVEGRLPEAFAGSTNPGFKDGNTTMAAFNNIQGITVNFEGTLYVTDQSNHAIREITQAGDVYTKAGTGSPGDVTGHVSYATLTRPMGITAGNYYTLYVSDTYNNKIKMVSGDHISFIAGHTFSGNQDGTGDLARFSHPGGMKMTTNGDLIVTDMLNHKLRKVTTAGVVTTLAGTGALGMVDGAAASAQFRSPYGLAIGPDGAIYVADRDNHAIRMISKTGQVTTLAGGGPGFGDFKDGKGSEARFYSPEGVAVDAAGNIYVADTQNHKIRKIIIQ